MKKWEKVKQLFEKEIEKIWLTEPLEIKKIRWGIMPPKIRAGSYDQYFSSLSHLATYIVLLGPHLLYNLLLAADRENITLDVLRDFARISLVEGFCPTRFLADMGLQKIHELSREYLKALNTVKTKDEFKELTGAFFTYANRTHRWVYNIFPWGLGTIFPQRKAEEIIEMAELLRKHGSKRVTSHIIF